MSERVSIVLPCLNEIATVASVVTEAKEALCRAEVMLVIHRLFRKRTGGAEAYLRAAGVSQASLDALRRRMLDGASRTT